MRKRESGENPERYRHCVWELLFRNHWETGKGQQVGMNSESEYSQLRIDTTHIRWHKRMFIFFQKIRKNGVKFRIFLYKKMYRRDRELR